MSADNRSTHTDALATLGTILNPGEKRDAIHLGVEPAVAGQELQPGNHVGYGPDGKLYNWIPGGLVKHVGIVDPFLEKSVYKDQRFWLIVYPRQITSLRHVWEHPDFPASNETGGGQLMLTQQERELKEHKARVLIGDPAAIAKDVLMNTAEYLGVGYEELMVHAMKYKDRGEHWSEGGRFEGVHINGDEFWAAYEEFTGEVIESNRRNNFLSCSC